MKFEGMCAIHNHAINDTFLLFVFSINENDVSEVTVCHIPDGNVTITFKFVTILMST